MTWGIVCARTLVEASATSYCERIICQLAITRAITNRLRADLQLESQTH